MASSYSDRLGLEKQGDGENPNSWGTKLNTVIDLVDEAIAGYAIVSVSSVAVSLTDIDGSADQSRNMMLEFAGTKTAHVTVNIPAEEKLYYIKNSSTGSFNLVLKPIGGTGVTVTNNIDTMMACNGSSIYQLQNPAASVSSATFNTLTVNTSFTAGDIYVSTIFVGSQVTVAIDKADAGPQIWVYDTGQDAYSVNINLGPTVLGADCCWQAHQALEIHEVKTCVGGAYGHFGLHSWEGNDDVSMWWGANGNGSASTHVTVTNGQLVAYWSIHANDGSTFGFNHSDWEMANRVDGTPAASAVPMSYAIGHGSAGGERFRLSPDGEFMIAGTTDRGAYNLQVNGTGVWGAGAYTNGSDIRIKENVSAIDTSVLDLIDEINPVTFKYKKHWVTNDHKNQVGFIAQELDKVLEGTKYQEGIVKKPNSEDYWSVAYSALIPILVKGMQELREENTELKDRLKAIEEKVGV